MNTHTRPGTHPPAHTHTLSLSLSQYVMRIAFTLQQWLHECVSIVRYTYIACLVWTFFRMISLYVPIRSPLLLFILYYFSQFCVSLSVLLTVTEP
jgi:hypothetical protein